MFNFNEWINKYPYTDFHELNIDWVIKSIKELAKELEQYEIVNKITYAGDWNISKQYSAWSVVVDGTSGYISTQPVPAGIQISNTDYWTPVANFTALYADLGTRVTALEYDMDEAEANIAYLDGLRNYQTRKVICISDSYGLTPTESTSWISNLKWYLNIPDSNFYRAQHNGSGFLGTQPSYKFVDLFHTIITNMSDDEKDAITDIVIGGGYNDANATHHGSTFAQVKTAMRNCLEVMRNQCPNARIYLCFMAWDKNSDWHASLRTVSNIYGQGMNYAKNVCVIDGNNWLHRTAFLDGTGLHPTVVGATALSETIASVMMGGTNYCDLAPSETDGTIIPTFASYGSNISGSVTMTDGHMNYAGGNCHFSWKNFQFSIAADVAPNYGVEIGTFNDTIMIGGPDLGTAYSCPVRVINNSHYADCVLAIYNNKLVLVNLDGQNLDAGTIQIQMGTMSGSCMM